MPKTHQISVRITTKLYDRLQAVTDQVTDPYATSLSRIIERGIVLALQELEAMRAGERPRKRRS